MPSTSFVLSWNSTCTILERWLRIISTLQLVCVCATYWKLRAEARLKSRMFQFTVQSWSSRPGKNCGIGWRHMGQLAESGFGLLPGNTWILPWILWWKNLYYMEDIQVSASVHNSSSPQLLPHAHYLSFPLVLVEGQVFLSWEIFLLNSKKWHVRISLHPTGTRLTKH